MKPPQSLPLQMVECLRRAQPDSVANHVTAHSIWRAITRLATETGRARSKRSAVWSGKLNSGYMIWYDVDWRYALSRMYRSVEAPLLRHSDMGRVWRHTRTMPAFTARGQQKNIEAFLRTELVMLTCSNCKKTRRPLHSAVVIIFISLSSRHCLIWIKFCHKVALLVNAIVRQRG